MIPRYSFFRWRVLGKAADPCGQSAAALLALQESRRVYFNVARPTRLILQPCLALSPAAMTPSSVAAIVVGAMPGMSSPPIRFEHDAKSHACQVALPAPNLTLKLLVVAGLTPPPLFTPSGSLVSLASQPKSFLQTAISTIWPPS
jgi:hypothetical protein